MGNAFHSGVLAGSVGRLKEWMEQQRASRGRQRVQKAQRTVWKKKQRVLAPLPKDGKQQRESLASVEWAEQRRAVRHLKYYNSGDWIIRHAVEGTACWDGLFYVSPAQSNTIQLH